MNTVPGVRPHIAGARSMAAPVIRALMGPSHVSLDECALSSGEFGPMHKPILRQTPLARDSGETLPRS